MSFVLDNSVAMRWLLPESNPSGVDYARAALEALKDAQAWCLPYGRWRRLT